MQDVQDAVLLHDHVVPVGEGHSWNKVRCVHEQSKLNSFLIDTRQAAEGHLCTTTDDLFGALYGTHDQLEYSATVLTD